VTSGPLQAGLSLRTIAHPNFPGQHLPYAIAHQAVPALCSHASRYSSYKELGEQDFRRNTMYAVIVTGGKQYKVAPGEYLKIEKLEIATGESVTFDRVLLVGNGDDVNIGAPVVAGATVVAEVVSQGRHDKVRIIKFRRRKNHMKRMGHRQWYTEIKITGIQA
jgi:large subunit ribosomal protein L21